MHAGDTTIPFTRKKKITIHKIMYNPSVLVPALDLCDV